MMCTLCSFFAPQTSAASTVNRQAGTNYYFIFCVRQEVVEIAVSSEFVFRESAYFLAITANYAYRIE